MPDFSGPLIVEQFPHGHSNLTYLLRAGANEFVLRRAPIGNQVKGAHDMGREYRVLSKLCAVYSPAPRPFLYCEDPDSSERALLLDGTPSGDCAPQDTSGRDDDRFRDGQEPL